MRPLGDRLRKLGEECCPSLHIIALGLSSLAELQEIFHFGLALLRLEIRHTNGLQKIKDAFS